MSFSKDFNDLVESKKSINEDIFELADSGKEPTSTQNTIDKIRNSRPSRPSNPLLLKIEENQEEEDDFYDAVGDQETL